MNTRILRDLCEKLCKLCGFIINKAKKTILLFLLLPLFGIAQVADDFSDGNFTENPTWVGDTSQFEVNTVNQLHLRSTGADTSVIAVQNFSIANTEWDFWIKLSFNTSSNNFARVYLVADHPDLKGILNGYYLQIGGSNDSIGFYRQNGLTSSRLFTGNRSFTGNSTNIIRIRVIHDTSGTWHLLSDNTGNANFTEEGSVNENTVRQTAWFGFYCRYTTSNSTKFYFDDVYVGPVIIDSIPPEIKEVEAVSGHFLDVKFSETIDKTGAENPENYFVSGYGNPTEVQADSIDPKIVHLVFSESFANATCDTLVIRNIKDLKGNLMKEGRVGFCIYKARSYDIVIDEIMADPTPQVGLPDAEYVELLNRTAFPIRLKNWIFEFGSYRKTLPDVTLSPKGFLILTKGSWLGFYGASIDLFTSSSSLNNEGTTLVLKNEEGKIIHSVTYSIDWYGNSMKAEGGWSLEMIDPGNPCGCSENWIASTNELGGTPGTINSVDHSNPDTTKPYLLRTFIEDEHHVRMVFSEPVDSSGFPSAPSWSIADSDNSFDSVSFIPPDFRAVVLHLTSSVQHGIVYSVNTPSGIRDCSGNLADTITGIQFAFPDTLSPLDIIINEILPNPYSGGERFIEIYNRSDKILDLKDLVLANTENSTDPVNISEDGYLFFPGQYLVLTKEPADLKFRYRILNPDNLIKLATMPAMNDDQGTVVIARKNDLVTIDRVDYTKEMQFALLTSTNGISLERINPSAPSNRKDNWHSASETCGFATPGYKNSQLMTSEIQESMVSLTPEIFSPDNDGKDDLLSIGFHLDLPGYIANVAIYDERGRLERQLIKNEMISPEGSFTWDGTTDDNRKAAIGIHIIRIDLFTPDGTVKHFNKALVVAARFQ